MTLLADLDAFYLEHRLCHGLTGDVQPASGGGGSVSMACVCGARLERRLDMEDPDA